MKIEYKLLISHEKNNEQILDYEKSGNPQSHAIRYTQETPTEYNSKRPGTKRKAKPHKKPKKRKEDVAEDVTEVTWFLRT